MWVRMNIRRYIWVGLLLLVLMIALRGRAEERFTLTEGLGIVDVGLLGEDIKHVQGVWGSADQAAKDDWSPSPYVFYEYHQQGVLFTTNKEGKILSITVYCDTGDKEPFHKTDLVWINPSAAYQTFRGETSQGLQFKDRLTPKEVYDVYGEPETTEQLGVDVKEKQREGKPFIVDMGEGGFSINYPQPRISCAVFGEFVESCTVSAEEY